MNPDTNRVLAEWSEVRVTCWCRASYVTCFHVSLFAEFSTG